jgi:hypothetical protein
MASDVSRDFCTCDYTGGGGRRHYTGGNDASRGGRGWLRMSPTLSGPNKHASCAAAPPATGYASKAARILQ